MKRASLTLCAIAVLCGAVSAAEPLNGNLFLTLERGLARGGGSYAPIELEIPIRDGNWSEQCRGTSMWYNRGRHRGTIKQNTVADGVRTLKIEVTVRPDPWVKGGKAVYTVKIERTGRRFTGSHKGLFTLIAQPKPGRRGPIKVGKGVPSELAKIIKKGTKRDKKPPAKPRTLATFDVGGDVRGKMGPAWPGVIEGHKPLPPGEHPRLVFRKHELPALRKRMDTPVGKAMIAQIKKILDKKPPSEGDKWTTWPAVGYGFMYRMTGEQKYADKAAKIVKDTILESRYGRGGLGISQDIHHAPRLVGLAVAYDLACDGWSDKLRGQAVDDIIKRIRECATGQFGGKGMRGLNLSTWSNHNGIRAAAYGIGALAVLGDKDSRGQSFDEAEDYAERAATEIREYLALGLGNSAYSLEGMFYKGMTMRRGLLQFMRAYEKVLGKQTDPEGIADFMITGYFLESKPGRLFSEVRPYDGIGKGLGVDSDYLPQIVFAMGAAAVPREMLPGFKQVLDENVGLEGDKTFGIPWNFYAPYAFAGYPWEVEAEDPDANFPWMIPDPRKGHYVFRPVLRDENDILLTTNLKSETLAACHYERSGILSELRLFGFGHKWIDGQYLPLVPSRPAAGNKIHGPVVTAEHRPADRAFVMDMDTSPAYLAIPPKKRSEFADAAGRISWRKLDHWSKGLADFGVRGTRSLAVDCTGRSGAPLLVAIVERIGLIDKPAEAQNPDAARPTTFAWALPAAGKVTADGSRFTVAQGDATITGVLASGQTLRDAAAAAEADGALFAVFTLQRGEAPKITVEGEGLDAKVTVGKRTVRFDGKTILLK